MKNTKEWSEKNAMQKMFVAAGTALRHAKLLS